VLSLGGQNEFFNLTHPQNSIWYLEQLNQGSGIGNISATLRINEDLDYDLMNRIVNEIIRKNDAFRIRLTERDGTVVQYITEYSEYRMEIHDFSNNSLEDLYTWDESRTNIPFDMLDNQLFEFAFLKIAPGNSALYIRIHHMIADAWSLVQAANEIMQHYNQVRNGQPWTDEPYPSYTEFVKSEQEYLRSERYESDRKFWLEEFARIPELTALKSKASRGIGLQTKRKSIVIPEKLTRKIRDYCREKRASIFSLFFSALCIYISRVKDMQDITIGTPVLNRTNAREKKTIGMFISTVPLRVQADGEQSFAEFSGAIDHKWFSVLKHQKYPYDHLVRDVRELHPGVEKLFDIAISYQNAKMEDYGEGYWHEARWHANKCQVESLYMHISDRETDSKIVLNYDYLTDLFYAKEIDFIHDHILRLLWHALDNPDRKLAQIHMLSEKESQKILGTFNANRAGYPTGETIGHLFERQAELHPDRPALVFGPATLSYHELNNRVNFLAHRLRRRGIGPETIVGLMLPRSLDMVIAILAIVKAGGAYMPIDPDYPEERVRYMLDDSKTRFLVSRWDVAGKIRFNGEMIDVNLLFQSYRSSLEWENPPVLSQPQNLLYVIYTSGSTGMPKGVMIEHQNVVQLLFNDQFQFDFGPGDCWTLFHSICFDFSVWEMYGALLNGGKLVIIPRETARNTDQFLEILCREKVTVLNQTPAAFYNLIEASRKLEKELSTRMVIFGGEALKPVMLSPFRKAYPNTRLINMYGITETTVHVTFYELSDEAIEKNISIVGRPLPTMKTYILDRWQHPQPIGIPGELCVSGAGIGRGYLNNELLTAAKFIPNPFVPGEIMYRSGDLARYFAEGDIEYLGRIDNQVKIRGHRIELGEIESSLLKFGPIKEATVQTRDTAGGLKRLCAYFVPSADFDLEELRIYLARFLPDYMMPAYFIKMDKIPLNGNGKIDQSRLPPPDPDVLSLDNYVEPQNDLQASIVKIWQEMLEISRVGINDNFFHLGGDSLSAMAVVTQIGCGITFADLYQNPTVKSLSEAILKLGPQAGPAGETVKNRRLTRLSKGNGGPRKNIICFPYGGGSGITYLELADALHKVSEQFCVYTVDLPGHDLSGQEEFQQNNEIASQLTREIKATVQGEIIIYGHCVGSALALETAGLLQQEQIRVQGIFVGGMLPPGQAWRLGKNFDPWKYASNKIIMRCLYVLGLTSRKKKNEHVDILIKAFRHDVRSFYRFFYEFEQKQKTTLDVPLHFVVGDRDLMTRNYQKKFTRWGRYARTVRLYVIGDAKHYFIKTHADELARILAEQK
jgi:amino acid adenylation domain-containing protein